MSYFNQIGTLQSLLKEVTIYLITSNREQNTTPV